MDDYFKPFEDMKNSMRDLFRKFTSFNNKQYEFIENLDRLSIGEKADICIGEATIEMYLTTEEIEEFNSL